MFCDRSFCEIATMEFVGSASADAICAFAQRRRTPMRTSCDMSGSFSALLPRGAIDSHYGMGKLTAHLGVNYEAEHTNSRTRPEKVSCEWFLSPESNCKRNSGSTFCWN